MVNFCPQCGTKIETGWKACAYCGHNLQVEREPQSFQQPLPTPSSSYNPQRNVQPQPIIYSPFESNIYGIIALIFGILGFFAIPIIGSLVAIILGSIGRKKDQSPQMANIGYVLGVIGLICGIIFIIIIISIFFSMISLIPTTPEYPYPF